MKKLGYLAFLVRQNGASIWTGKQQVSNVWPERLAAEGAIHDRKLDRSSRQPKAAFPEGKMTDQEKLKRDIDILRESIRLGWLDMASNPMTPEERRELRPHIAGLAVDLAALLERLK